MLQACGRVVGGAGTGEALSYALWFHDMTGLSGELAGGHEVAASARSERDKLQEVLDLAPFPAWRCGHDLAIEWVNRAYVTIVEADAARIVRDNIEFAVGPGPQHSRGLAAMARQTGAAQTDQRRFNVGGERRVFEFTETPLSGGGIMGIAIDVTAREEAWHELRRHTEAYAAVMDRLRAAIAIFGPDRRLRFFNEAYMRLWRLDEKFLSESPAHGEILERLREARVIPEQADFRAYKAQVMNLYASVLAPEEEFSTCPTSAPCASSSPRIRSAA